MTYSDEKLLALPVTNGWRMTADRTHKNRSGQSFFVAECVQCEYRVVFDSIPIFLKNKRLCRECNRYSPEDRALRYHESIYKYNARKANRAWEMTFEDFTAFVKSPCFYCGDQPMQKILGGEWPFAGIDRIDNSGGYTMNNIRPCCRVCNVAKNSMTEDEFLQKVISWHARLIDRSEV